MVEPGKEQLLARLDIFDSIDSTNTYLLAQGKLGAVSGTVCLAEQQTQGRGRLGRVWYSPCGANIYCSLLWRFSSVSHDISGLSIAVATIVANTLRQYGILAGIQLKWPNDVLFAHRKLAGILLERSDQSGVVIGIGLNIDVSSAGEKSWIDLSEIMGRVVSRNYLVGLLINELLEKLPIYEKQGLPPFISEWQKYDVLFDKPISVHTPQEVILGTMRGITEKGELLLLNEKGFLQPFCYGEVSVRS